MRTSSTVVPQPLRHGRYNAKLGNPMPTTNARMADWPSTLLRSAALGKNSINTGSSLRLGFISRTHAVVHACKRQWLHCAPDQGSPCKMLLYNCKEPCSASCHTGPAL